MKRCRAKIKDLGISSRTYSKLKIIGKTLLDLKETHRAELIQHLPSSYGTIYALCGLGSRELLNGLKSGAIHRNLSTRSAINYVEQIRYPKAYKQIARAARNQNSKEKIFFSVASTNGKPLQRRSLHDLENRLRVVCDQYGMSLSQTPHFDTEREAEKTQILRERAWREVLRKDLSKDWFQQCPKEIRTKFNIRTAEELHNAPMRIFTGFLQYKEGRRVDFWERCGKAYVAKIQLEIEITDNYYRRYNLTRRLQKIFKEREPLSAWSESILSAKAC